MTVLLEEADNYHSLAESVFNIALEYKIKHKEDSDRYG